MLYAFSLFPSCVSTPPKILSLVINFWNVEGTWKVTQNYLPFQENKNFLEVLEVLWVYKTLFSLSLPGCFWLANISFLAFTCGGRYIFKTACVDGI